MSSEDNKALVQRHFERTDQRDLEGAAEAYASDFRFYGLAPRPLDPVGWKQTLSAFLAAFPDSRFVIDDLIAEGDRVAVRHPFQGTHQAEFQGIAPTGKQVVVPGIVIYRVANGKLVEAWLNADFLGMLQQLGVIPAPGHGGA